MPSTTTVIKPSSQSPQTRLTKIRDLIESFVEIAIAETLVLSVVEQNTDMQSPLRLKGLKPEMGILGMTCPKSPAAYVNDPTKKRMRLETV